MTKTHEEQADEYVEMFMPYVDKTRINKHDNQPEINATESAIKHVEGLIKQVDLIAKKQDEWCYILEEIEVNLISIKTVLEQRINK